ncbi:unnamed protein product [Auanema sp. JU1783]|nr:unnamed protein product [Auanema sp. JU1783]
MHLNNKETKTATSRKRPLPYEQLVVDTANDSFDEDGDVFCTKKPNLSDSPAKGLAHDISKKRSPKILVEKDINQASENNTNSVPHSTKLTQHSSVKENFIFDNNDVVSHRSSKLGYLEKGDREGSNDSFDIPLTFTSAKNDVSDADSFDELCGDSPEVKYKEIFSGVDGFPSLNDSRLKKKFIIKEISHDDYTLTLTCTDNKDVECVVYLQGIWSETKVEVGMAIGIIGGKLWGGSDWLVNDEEGLAIANPDVLVPCTSIASSSWCTRKVIINDRFKMSIEPNKAMLIGCIMHELFQVAIQCPNPAQITHEWIFSRWRNDISSNVMESFVALTFSPRGFEAELKPYAEVIVTWVRNHIPNKGKVFSKALKMPTGNSIEEVHDIEENVWEPLLGIKGKIDATLLTTNKGVESLLEPLELKTGKSKQSFEHSSQVLLYCMMLSIRYNQPIRSGSLLYLKDGVTRTVTPKALDLKGILKQRNDLAFYFAKKDLSFPEPRNDPHFCGKCDQALTCSLLQVGYKSPASDAFKSFAEGYLNHLNESEIKYFQKWIGLINLEWNREIKSLRKLSSLWNEDPDTRESKGFCAAHMKFEGAVKKDSYYLLKFERPVNIPEGVFQPSVMCTVSSDTHSGILLSAIFASDCNSITIRYESSPKIMKCGKLYHIDVYNSFSTYVTTTGNVSNLMGSDELSTKHRKSIVRLEPPQKVESDRKNLPLAVQHILRTSSVNKEQEKAIISSLCVSDYSLIEGLPGTGKTCTIAVLVRCLVASGKSVLITSFTNSAVDNILVKLAETISEEKLLRLGNENAMRPEVKRLALGQKIRSENCEDVYKEMRSILKETPVVCCTCHNTSRDVLFSWRKFDICIVDEASMVLEPVMLSALATTSKFVLVGDANQLSPLVQDKEAREGGMGVSLFEKLSQFKQCVTSLVSQYRMNEQISRVSSELFYDSRMICVSEKVKTATIKPSAKEVSSAWETLVLSSKIDDSCVFIDTDSENNQACSLTSKVGSNVQNKGEAIIVDKLVKILIERGIQPEDIGVMCLYRKQVDYMRQILDCPSIEVNTVDQYQGRDKSVIIWSLVWTKNSGKKCELLTDHRRVNVALTRAKHKMIVVGCSKNSEVDNRLFKLNNFNLIHGAVLITILAVVAMILVGFSIYSCQKHKLSGTSSDGTRSSTKSSPATKTKGSSSEDSLKLGSKRNTKNLNKFPIGDLDVSQPLKPQENEEPVLDSYFA